MCSATISAILAWLLWPRIKRFRKWASEHPHAYEDYKATVLGMTAGLFQICVFVVILPSHAYMYKHLCEYEWWYDSALVLSVAALSFIGSFIVVSMHTWRELMNQKSSKPRG